VPVKSGKKQKLEEARNLSASAKKTKAAQMIIASDNPSHLDSYVMVIIIAVHMMHSLQSYMKSGPLTQGLGQEDSRKSTSIISSQWWPVSRNISMVRQALKLPEILSDMNFTLKVLHNFPIKPEAPVFQL
jgi:hypothetical protein